jgi:hypothetical protein
MYLADLSDADLLVRPAPKANHIAWQLGHLIKAERDHLTPQMIPGLAYPALPPGFDEQHGKQAASQDPPRGFRTKDEYLNLFGQVREKTLAALEGLSDADLDKPTVGPMAPYAPTLGALIQLQANHTLMHAGQFTVVRRLLNKPVLF